MDGTQKIKREAEVKAEVKTETEVKAEVKAAEEEVKTETELKTEVKAETGTPAGRVKKNTLRHLIQAAALVFFNGYLKGYQTGKIFKGNSKYICVPVLNCYSCPGALGACPIGSLQSMLNGHKHRFSFYVLGCLMLFGIVLGRAVCGFLCPFGLVQDLLYKIPFLKKELPESLDKPLRYLKYLVLLVMVILLPLFLKDRFGIGTTYFCKYICPAGTLGAGLPMLALNKSLRTAIGGLFHWKLALLIVILLLSMVIYRSFCKYLCPLGAIYSLFNKFSFYRMKLDREKCVDCRLCEKVCRMKVEVTKNINSPECIRCGKCADVCPKGAISCGFSAEKSAREK